MSLHLNAVSTAYGKTIISHAINLECKAGEFIGLVGPNGSGKSCLLKTIAGVLPLYKGDIDVGGQSLRRLTPRARAKKISYLAQGGQVSWPLPVRAIIALGRAPYRGALGQISQSGQEAIDAAIRTTQCAAFLQTPYDRLSGGEQARVNLARALAVGADIMLTDEPTNHLDPYFQLSIMEILKGEAARGKTVITALHDLHLAKRFCTRLLVLNHGDIIADTPADKALSNAVLREVFHIKHGKDGFIAHY